MKLKILLFSVILFAFDLSVSAQSKSPENKSVKTQNVKKSATEPLKIGEIAPDFKLSDENGRQIALSKAKKPVVLVFYRGYW
ncbi:MAG: redoxin domain-containing protein [Pyrinomonadaceae bacterium]|nr:redoxin domain-containing protein [Pyrinomonadaceae bacterium]